MEFQTGTKTEIPSAEVFAEEEFEKESAGIWSESHEAVTKLKIRSQVKEESCDFQAVGDRNVLFPEGEIVKVIVKKESVTDDSDVESRLYVKEEYEESKREPEKKPLFEEINEDGAETLDEKPLGRRRGDCKKNNFRLNKKGGVTKKNRNDNKEKIYKCGNCEYSTNRKSSLVRHARVHTTDRPFKCDKCEFAAYKASRLTNHTFAKHSNGEKRHKCGYCEYSTDTKRDLVIHVRVHTDEKPFECDECEYTARQRHHLKRHVVTNHPTEEEKYRCDECGYSTGKKSDLKVHVRVHARETSFRCDKCEYATGIRSYLRHHVSAKHNDYTFEECNLLNDMGIRTGEKMFKCSSCEYATSLKSRLKYHTRIKHSDEEKRFKCEECSYSTHIKSSLISHIRTHTNERPFKCDQCEFAATQKGRLNMHRLSQHSGKEKKFTKRNLITHEHVQTEEKPLQEKLFDRDTRKVTTPAENYLKDSTLTRHSDYIDVKQIVLGEVSINSDEKPLTKLTLEESNVDPLYLPL